MSIKDLERNPQASESPSSQTKKSTKVVSPSRTFLSWRIQLTPRKHVGVSLLTVMMDDQNKTRGAMQDCSRASTICDLLFDLDGPTTNPLFLVYTAVATNHQTMTHLKAKQQELDEPRR
ncbi:serine threonine-protein kinase [Musa troglodytarum]|uniref:Serine threonine-protein kinase n=1 Tax=Musa troglodytarum TaxID=320322 RepID=A0A9E7JMI6_9LILI|nr:serine threonine-protein kinase [Musa troglodytarum]